MPNSNIAASLLAIKPVHRTADDVEQLVTCLSEQPFFSGVSLSHLQLLSSYLALHRAAPGNVVVQSGEVTDRLCLLLGGRCSVSRHSRREGFQPPAPQPLLPGQAVCEAALVVSGRTSDITVTVTGGGGDAREGGGEEGEGAVLAVLTRTAWSDMCARAPIQPECGEARLALLCCCARSLAATPPEQRSPEQAEDLAALLRHMPGLSHTPAHVLREMSGSARLAALPAGTVLFEEHSRGDCEFLVLSGAVEMHVRPKRKGGANRAALRSALKSAVAAARTRSALGGRSRGGAGGSGGGAGGAGGGGQKTIRQKIEEERRAREEIRKTLALQREGLRTPQPQPAKRRPSRAKEVGEEFKRWMLDFLNKKRAVAAEDGSGPSWESESDLRNLRGAYGGRSLQAGPPNAKTADAWRRAAYRALHPEGAGGSGGGARGHGWPWGEGGAPADMTMLDYERRKHEEAGGMRDVGNLLGGAAARRAYMQGINKHGGGYADDQPEEEEGAHVHWGTATEVGGGSSKAAANGGEQPHGVDGSDEEEDEEDEGIEEDEEEADPWVRLTYLDRRYRVVRKAIRYMTAVEKVMGIATSSSASNAGSALPAISQSQAAASASHGASPSSSSFPIGRVPSLARAQLDSDGLNADAGGDDGADDADADANDDGADGDAAGDDEDDDDPIQALLLASGGESPACDGSSGSDREGTGDGCTPAAGTAAAAVGPAAAASSASGAGGEATGGRGREQDTGSGIAATAATLETKARGVTSPSSAAPATASYSTATGIASPAAGTAAAAGSATAAGSTAATDTTVAAIGTTAACTTATAASGPVDEAAEVFEACEEHLEQLYGGATGLVEAGQVAGELMQPPPEGLLPVVGAERKPARQRRAYSGIAGPSGADVLVVALSALRRGHAAVRDDMISERLAALTALEPLRGLSDEHQAQVALGCKLLCLDANQLIVRQGQQVEAMYVVMEGEVRLLDDPDGLATASTVAAPPQLQPLSPPGGGSGGGSGGGASGGGSSSSPSVPSDPPSARLSSTGMAPTGAAAAAGGGGAGGGGMNGGGGGGGGGGGQLVPIKGRRTVGSLAPLTLLGPGGSFGESVLGFPEDIRKGSGASASTSQGRGSTGDGSELSFPGSAFLASAVAARACKLLVLPRSLLARFAYLRSAMPPFAAQRREAILGRRQQLKNSLMQGRPGNSQAVAVLRAAEFMPGHQLPVLLAPMPSGGSGSSAGSGAAGGAGGAGGAGAWHATRPPPMRMSDGFEPSGFKPPVLRRVFNGLSKPAPICPNGGGGGGGNGSSSPATAVLASLSNGPPTGAGSLVSPSGGSASAAATTSPFPSPSPSSPIAPLSPPPPPPPPPIQDRRRRQDLVAASTFAPNSPHQLNNALIRPRADDPMVISALASPRPIAPLTIRQGALPQFRTCASVDGSGAPGNVLLPIAVLASPTVAASAGACMPGAAGFPVRMRASASGAIGGDSGGCGGAGPAAGPQNHAAADGCGGGVSMSASSPTPQRYSTSGLPVAPGGGGSGQQAPGTATAVTTPRSTRHAPLPKLASPISVNSSANGTLNAAASAAVAMNGGSGGAPTVTLTAVPVVKPLLRPVRHGDSLLVHLDSNTPGRGSCDGGPPCSPHQHGNVRNGRSTTGTGVVPGGAGSGSTGSCGAAGGGMPSLTSPLILQPLRPMGQQSSRT
ncbi:hypothetical protein Agub_g5332 [Astrephomene gubernaculifera]|uniref:Cyclic nucleotide-binding domain-containing protein n=1 Tax=Astrephomene gubernaculifera TaxID=47775 RepID=A0AAD3DNU1_9CHLO|nr:hypothetical protein Agub_g5332 [Astrephomene gubernaculifera]